MKLLREVLAGDRYRPAYHFVAPGEYLNDPNGTVFWRGRYHLFYQYAPDWRSGDWNKHWAHAISSDLVHWEDLPIALSPEPGTYDEKGIWSGTACNDGDRVWAIYHAHQSGNCLASASDDLLTDWTKHPANPVIPPDPAHVYDPCIWKDERGYHTLSGRISSASTGDGRDVLSFGHDLAYHWRSDDLTNWEDTGLFYEGGFDTEPGEDCAVPEFFPFGDRHMLLFASHNRGGQYYIGRLEDDHFTPETHGRLNFTRFGLARINTCGDLMAPLSWGDDQGRRIVIAWVPEGTTDERQFSSGWAGIMSLPRVLSLDAAGQVHIAPVPQLEALRGQPVTCGGMTVTPEAPVWLEGVESDRLELDLVLEPGSATTVGINVLCSPHNEEETTILFDREAQTLSLDPTRASLDVTMVGRAPQVAPFALATGEALRLRVFIDRSVVEVFANDRLCLTKRVYPSRPDSLGVQFFTTRGLAMALSATAWEMQPVWPVD